MDATRTYAHTRAILQLGFLDSRKTGTQITSCSVRPGSAVSSLAVTFDSASYYSVERVKNKNEWLREHDGRDEGSSIGWDGHSGVSQERWAGAQKPSVKPDICHYYVHNIHIHT